MKSHKIKLRNKSNDYSSLDKNKDATTMKSSLHCWLPNIQCELNIKLKYIIKQKHTSFYRARKCWTVSCCINNIKWWFTYCQHPVWCRCRKSTTVIQTNRAAEQKPPERFTNWTNTHQLSLQQTHPLTAQTTCFIITQTSTWIYQRNLLLYHVTRLLIQWLTETRVMILVSGKTCNIHGFDINFMN